ncbi:TRAP transporter small permease subunit [Leeia sp.]|uniref:TRAP transporter small permease subunit n=1 Tax=Leeia sp. TaxID=2884678 RepID=UPI0035AF6F52
MPYLATVVIWALAAWLKPPGLPWWVFAVLAVLLGLVVMVPLRFSRCVDGINRWIGQSAAWLVLAVTLLTTLHALVRKFFNKSELFHQLSLSVSESSWYLFAAIFMLGGAYTLLENEHVRIDILFGNLSRRMQHVINLLGGVLFLLPMTLLLVYFSWPDFVRYWASGENGGDAGSLVRWPVKGLIPLGFALLSLQGVSEIIKSLARLTGKLPDDAPRHEADPSTGASA